MTTIRCAAYTRFSTDDQNPDSCEDQLREIRDYIAKREGWELVPDLVVMDAGISGAARQNRPGLLDLVNRRWQEYDVLVCMAYSRIARDTEDLSWVRNQLHKRKRRAFDVKGNEIGDLSTQVLGIIDQQFRASVSDLTKKGSRGRVETKRSAGGTPFGYQTEFHGRGAVAAACGDAHELGDVAAQLPYVRRRCVRSQ